MTDTKIDAEDLVARAVRNARIPGTYRWVAVKRVFGVGSTRAEQLCRDHGLDPDETIPHGDPDVLTDEEPQEEGEG